ncbi:MAG: glutamyl-tRNA reductase [Deltaproteobacteria bacterium]|nr:glutamyl-tRNA reductase [Deltaproteobacteria bacterium]
MILCWGVNHTVADTAQREALALTVAQRQSWLQGAVAAGLREHVLLATCNRTELYTVLPDDAEPSCLDNFVRTQCARSHAVLTARGYRHQDEAAVRHLFSVAASLDSMIVGEAQILGQVKSAFAEALAAGTVGSVTHGLFAKAFQVAKQVRERTGIGRHPISVASVGVALAQQVFGQLQDCTGLIIGAGEMGELTARHFRKAGVGRLLIVNRTFERAAVLAAEVGGEACPVGSFETALGAADIIICSASGDVPLLDAAQLERVRQQRGGRPQFVIDIAFPRGVDEAVANLPQVYLYTLDDLQRVAAANANERQHVVRDAEAIVARAAAQYWANQRPNASQAAIASLHQKWESIRQEEVARSLGRFGSPNGAVATAMEACTKALIAKLLRDPILHLKGEGADATSVPPTPDAPPAEAHHWLRRLFRLGSPDA